MKKQLAKIKCKKYGRKTKRKNATDRSIAHAF